MTLRPPPRPVSPVPLYDLCPACEATSARLVGCRVNAPALACVAAVPAEGAVGWRFRCVRCLRIADEVGGA